MKQMTRAIYMVILPLVVLSGLAIANGKVLNETKPSPKPLAHSDKKAQLEGRKKWEASPDGIMFKKWAISPEGKKIHASHDNIREYLRNFSKMEALVTSVTFQRKNSQSSGPKWLIVRIDGQEYMMQFNSNEFQQLKSLKVNDQIILRSHSAGYSPNHPYLIVSGDYIEHNNKMLFKREFSKNGC
jgi:hypothetical protein